MYCGADINFYLQLYIHFTSSGLKKEKIALWGMHLREICIPEKGASFFFNDASKDANLPGQTKSGLGDEI